MAVEDISPHSLELMDDYPIEISLRFQDLETGEVMYGMVMWHKTENEDRLVQEAGAMAKMVLKLLKKRLSELEGLE